MAKKKAKTRSANARNKARRAQTRGTAAPRAPAPAAAAAGALSNEDVERALRTGEDAGLLEDYFGPADYAELRELSQRAAAKRGAAGPRVLILPGIMGSQLGTRRANGGENVIWFAPLKIAAGAIAKVALNGDNSIVPLGAILLFYEKLKLRLRTAGFDAEFFAYDWRQSIDDLGKQLAQHLRDREQDGVALVCHSMGGLVARAAVAALGEPGKPRIARVVQLGTPNFGSFNAVQTLRALGDTIKQLAFLDLRHDAAQIVNDVIAPMPGACQLLPSPEKFAAIDLFDAAAWPKTGPRPSAPVLKKVPAVLQQLAPADDRFYLIAGINRETVIGVRVDELTKEFVFQISMEGDGTVPLALAQLPGVKATYYIEEKHGALPNNRIVAHAVADILSTGATAALPDHPAALRTRTVREVPESELRQREPYQGRRGGQLSQRELREVLDEFLSTETSDAIAPQQALVPAAMAEALTQGFDRLVVGRRRQRRIDVRLAAGDIGEVKAHAVVVGIYSSVAPSGAAKALDDRLDGAITELTQRRMFSGNVGEVFLLPTAQRSVRAEMVAFVGLGAFDTFTSDVLRIAAENAIRTLVLGGIGDVATVLIGSGSGASTASALESLLTGFVKGLLDADKADSFRSLTVCEANPDTYEQIKREVFRLSATPLFEDLELTFFEDTLPAPAPVAADAGRGGRPARGRDPIYLLVRQESAVNGKLQLRTSVLGAGSKATVVSGTRVVAASALAQKLEDLQKSSFKFERSRTFGAELAAMVVSEEALAVLAANADRHVVVVHDAESSRIPWELLSVQRRSAGRSAKTDAVLLAKEAGVSRRYVADNLSVAKWLEERRQDQRFNLLLVVNPTKDLDGAEEEGERVKKILAGVPGVDIDVLEGDDASRPALERAFRSGKYDAIHYAGHAFFDERDPASSGILCAKEAVLSGRDLVGLGNLPVLVFFNACEAGRVRGRVRARARGGAPRARAADKTMRQRIQENVGLAEAFLRGGVANYVGTYWPVGDDAAFRFAEQFYKALMRGAAIGDALLEGRRTVFTAQSVDWADYIHYGSADFVVKLAPP